VHFSFPRFSVFLAILKVIRCAFLIFHFVYFSCHIPGSTVCISHFQLFSVFVLFFFLFLFLFFAIFQVVKCAFLIFHVFQCFSPCYRSYNMLFSFSMFFGFLAIFQVLQCCVSFSTFFSFLAIFQFLKCALHIFDVFQCF
jgi:hypothetical protein